MKNIIATYILIIGFALLTLTASALIGFQLQLTAARNFHTGCINQLQASNFLGEVETACIEQAREYGYTLTIDDDTIYEGRRNVLVRLDYTATMPFLEVSKDGYIQGYAK